MRNDIPSKMISIEKLPTDIFLIELNLRKKKWLINCSYNPNNGNNESHLDSFSSGLSIHLNKYENLILLGVLTQALKIVLLKVSARIMIRKKTKALHKSRGLELYWPDFK